MIYYIGPLFHMDIIDYHAHSGVSKSKLDSIAKSPLHYWSRWCDPSRLEPAPTPAMERGTAVHMAVLEPEKFAVTYAQAPDVSRTTKAGKLEWELAAADGKKLLKTDDWDTVQYMLRSVLEHPMAHKILAAPGRAEESFFAQCPSTGLELKCRPDWLTDSGWLVDLKTTQDASLKGFQKAVATYRYHVQAAHYLNVFKLATGTQPRGFIFIAVESTDPWAVQVFEASPLLIEAGALEVNRNLQALAHAASTYPLGLPWPGYSQHVTTLDPPTWMSPRLPEM